jgi:1-deoxy-D-xylulose-5-phosphate synthase
VKPLDTETILKAVDLLPLVVTIEEGTLEGGFGSAVLEAANKAGLNTQNIVRCGFSDQFVEHGERHELLADAGLDVAGFVATVRKHREADAERGSLSSVGMR